MTTSWFRRCHHHRFRSRHHHRVRVKRSVGGALAGRSPCQYRRTLRLLATGPASVSYTQVDRSPCHVRLTPPLLATVPPTVGGTFAGRPPCRFRRTPRCLAHVPASVSYTHVGCSLCRFLRTPRHFATVPPAVKTAHVWRSVPPIDQSRASGLVTPVPPAVSDTPRRDTRDVRTRRNNAPRLLATDPTAVGNAPERNAVPPRVHVRTPRFLAGLHPHSLHLIQVAVHPHSLHLILVALFRMRLLRLLHVEPPKVVVDPQIVRLVPGRHFCGEKINASSMPSTSNRTRRCRCPCHRNRRAGNGASPNRSRRSTALAWRAGGTACRRRRNWCTGHR